MANMLASFTAARRVSTPLIGIRSFDPNATIEAICGTIDESHPKLRWDIQNGLLPINSAAQAPLKKLLDGRDAQGATGSPADCLAELAKLPENSIVFFLNANRTWESQDMARTLPVIQGIWNLREPFKQNSRTLVLLSSEFTLPSELMQDVLILDEPLPNADQLANIVRETWRQGHDTKPLPEETLNRAIDAVRGLSAFPAEQVVAMSLKAFKDDKRGIDIETLWDRKRDMIEQTQGLSVPVFAETFDNVGGCHNVKKYLAQYNRGPEAPRVYVFIDEIEKALAGASGDTSGVSADILGTLLSYMEDKQTSGLIFVGPPGAAKSMIAKAAGNDAGVPTIGFDVGSMKGQFVGQSEKNIRTALKIISAVSDDRACFIATCNRISVLPPELLRRFSMGTFFFDLPSKADREAIWSMYLKKFNVTPKRGESIDDDNWTGAEIRNCVRTAYRLGCSLSDAAKFIVPTFRSMGDRLTELRNEADGKYIDASAEGFYTSPVRNLATGSAARKLSLTSEN